MFNGKNRNFDRSTSSWLVVISLLLFCLDSTNDPCKHFNEV